MDCQTATGQETAIFQIVSMITNRNTDVKQAINELEERLRSIMSPPSPATEVACKDIKANCQLEEILKQASNEMERHIYCLRNILDRLQL